MSESPNLEEDNQVPKNLRESYLDSMDQKRRENIQKLCDKIMNIYRLRK